MDHLVSFFAPTISANGADNSKGFDIYVIL